MRFSATVTAIGAGILLADAVTGTMPDVAIIGVAFVLSGIAGVVLTLLLPTTIVSRRTRAQSREPTARPASD